jgi:predicted glycoside hydrolase/deacetylase ChbG (UPF0249 family)
LKHLIINADDFGFTRDVNAGIIKAHREGVLTSATLMANGAAFEDAVQLARSTPSLDLGCHLVLVQGPAVAGGEMLPETPHRLLGVLAQGKLDVYKELRAQIEKVLTAGVSPTHLDSHKHTHLVPGIFATVVRLAHEFSIPYVRLPFDCSSRLGRLTDRLAGPYYRRVLRRENVHTTDHFRGFQLTGSLTEETFAAALTALPEGSTEFMCHPGFLGNELAQSATRLKQSRVRELEALTSPRIRALLNAEEVRLGPFPNIAGERRE